MSDGLINRDAPSRKWVKVIAWVYIVLTFVGGFTGLLDRIVPLPYGMMVPYTGVALVMLAYRRPGRSGWILVLFGWAVVAAATFRQLTR